MNVNVVIGTNPSEFPRVAKEMGFRFSMKRGRVDWHKIDGIDIDRLVYERDLVTLKENLTNITNYNLENDYDVKILDSGFVKLFKLAQLSIDYLMYSEQHLYNCIELIREEHAVCLKDNERLKKAIQKKDNLTKDLKKRVKEKGKQKMNKQFFTTYEKEVPGFHKCVHCPKAFVSAWFLQAHHMRRHQSLSCAAPAPPDAPLVDAPPTYFRELAGLRAEIQRLRELLQNHENKENVSTTCNVALKSEILNGRQSVTETREPEDVKSTPVENTSMYQHDIKVLRETVKHKDQEIAAFKEQFRHLCELLERQNDERHAQRVPLEQADVTSKPIVLQLQQQDEGPLAPAPARAAGRSPEGGVRAEDSATSCRSDVSTEPAASADGAAHRPPSTREVGFAQDITSPCDSGQSQALNSRTTPSLSWRKAASAFGEAARRPTARPRAVALTVAPTSAPAPVPAPVTLTIVPAPVPAPVTPSIVPVSVTPTPSPALVAPTHAPAAITPVPTLVPSSIPVPVPAPVRVPAPSVATVATTWLHSPSPTGAADDEMDHVSSETSSLRGHSATTEDAAAAASEQAGAAGPIAPMPVPARVLLAGPPPTHSTDSGSSSGAEEPSQAAGEPGTVDGSQILWVQLRKQLIDVAAQHIKVLGIDPSWNELPEASFLRVNSLMAHQRSICNKSYAADLVKLRESLARSVEAEASSRRARAAPRRQPAERVEKDEEEEEEEEEEEDGAARAPPPPRLDRLVGSVRKKAQALRSATGTHIRKFARQIDVSHPSKDVRSVRNTNSSTDKDVSDRGRVPEEDARHPPARPFASRARSRMELSSAGMPKEEVVVAGAPVSPRTVGSNVRVLASEPSLGVSLPTESLFPSSTSSTDDDEVTPIPEIGPGDTVFLKENSIGLSPVKSSLKQASSSSSLSKKKVIFAEKNLEHSLDVSSGSANSSSLTSDVPSGKPRRQSSQRQASIHAQSDSSDDWDEPGPAEASAPQSGRPESSGASGGTTESGAAATSWGAASEGPRRAQQSAALWRLQDFDSRSAS